MLQSILPYAIPKPVFPFRHLAGLAARAPIGGAREVALACFMAARLAAELIPASGRTGLTAELRAVRSAAATSWLATLTLPAAIRTSLTRCIDGAAHGSAEALGSEIAALGAACASVLDAASCAELKQLADSLA